jgi:hypothetical protein
MSDQTPTGARQTYLTEHYLPGLSVAELDDAAARVREAVSGLERMGEPVHFRHATIVATDEAFLCVIEALSEELIRLACARARTPFDRISAAHVAQR